MLARSTIPFGSALGFWVVCCSTVLSATPSPHSARSAISQEVDFERHIMGLFGRMGCNSGACHGSFQGRGGFRLSLFGYDAERDYAALTRDAFGRRVNLVDPDNSLILLKPTGAMEHGGGVRFARGSWQYQLLRNWIMDGAQRLPGRGRISALEPSPPQFHLSKVGDSGRLTIHARFADGSEEDVSRFCEFRSNDDAVVVVNADGEIRATGAGDTSLVISYCGNVATVRALVPVEAPPGFQYPDVAEDGYIDREVFAKLRKLNIVPSERTGDHEFLRRVTIDTIGSLPSPADVRAFLADTDPNKRLKKIDALLAHPLHAALWATKLCDITGNDTDALEQPRDMQTKWSQMWHDWLRKRIAENRPYDEIVRGILCATSRDGKSPEQWIKERKLLEDNASKGFATSYAERTTLDLFWRRQANVPIEEWGERTAAAFMGIRLECAQCHKHPFDRWTQTDYRAYANVFGQVAFGASPEAKKAIDAENAERSKQQGKVKVKPVLPVREVFLSEKGRSLPDPNTKRPLPAQCLGGPIIKMEKGKDARQVLFDWLRSPGNPFFARSFVNRAWAHYLGVGVVDPPDDFSQANPPSNERLLDALAQDFANHHYDIRRLERTIICSQVYQLSSQPNGTNRLDHRNYSHFYVRPMMAEVVFDVLNSALGVTDKMGPDGPGSRAIEVGSSRVQNGNLAYAFRVFGRPPRTSACDCQRAAGPALSQVLYRMTDPNVLGKLQRGRLAALLKSKKTDAEILNDLFLATLTRPPTEGERQAFEAYRLSQSKRSVAFADTLWALINTREFVLNH
jgi:hypothetical protein